MSHTGYTPPFTVSADAINLVAEIYVLTKVWNTFQLSTILGISDRMVRKHITLLKTVGLLSWIGSNKSGYWHVVE